MSAQARKPCPCGLPATLQACCGRYHAGIAAPTPEALMRSRYSAYALGLTDYVRETWHPSSLPADLDLSTPGQLRWVSLKVVAAAMQDPDHGTVEFIAQCKVGGREQTMHENSRFVRENGRWYYVDGDFVEP